MIKTLNIFSVRHEDLGEKRRRYLIEMKAINFATLFRVFESSSVVVETLVLLLSYNDVVQDQY